MRKAERRQAILNHARDVFARRGYQDAKIEEIVAAAGIAQGTFYLYFEDKRAVFEEIVDRAFTQIGMAIVRVDPADTARTIADQVRENIRRLVGTLLADRPTTQILLTAAVGMDPAFDRKLQSFYEVVENLLAQSLREGQELGVVAPGDTRMFTHVIFGAMKEILYQVVRREAEFSEEQVVDGLYDFLGQGCLRVPPVPAASKANRTKVGKKLEDGVKTSARKTARGRH